MPAHETRLVAAEPLSTGTAAFHFARPPGFKFAAGQAIDLVLPGDGAPKHTFSVVSAPAEDRLSIATRLRGSPYKRALAALKPGAAAAVEGPYGKLTLQADAARPAVLVAGGIGVTPFMSMLRQQAAGGPARRMALVYSNRNPGESPFLAELAALEQRASWFRLLATMTAVDAADTSWTGRVGRIDGTLLREALEQGPRPVCYVAGSPAFVRAMHDALAAAGATGDEVRSEEFFGY